MFVTTNKENNRFTIPKAVIFHKVAEFYWSNQFDDRIVLDNHVDRVSLIFSG